MTSDRTNYIAQRLPVTLVYDFVEILGDLSQPPLMRRRCPRRFRITQPIVKIADRHIEALCNLVQPAGRDAIGAALILMHLLGSNTDHVGELLLRRPEHDAALADSHADMEINWPQQAAPLRLCHDLLLPL